MATLDDLRTFIAAARLGSFAGAARQLNLSPAMVGRRIQGLEERYRIKLIERTTRTQHLTEQGAEFLMRAEAVLDAAEALAECSSDSGALSVPAARHVLAIHCWAAQLIQLRAEPRQIGFAALVLLHCGFQGEALCIVQARRVAPT